MSQAHQDNSYWCKAITLQPCLFWNLITNWFLSFVAYPRAESSLEPIRITKTYYANRTSVIRLDCDVMPGALVQQYYVAWRARYSDLVYYRIIPPEFRSQFNTSHLQLNSRYSLDSSNFSLFIENASFQDTGSTYLCYVGVEDPLHPEISLQHEINKTVFLIDVLGKSSSSSLLLSFFLLI